MASSGEYNADAAMAGRLIAREPGPVEVYSDSAYGTGELRTALVTVATLAVIRVSRLSVTGAGAGR